MKNNPEVGLYIHIPFCRVKCTYCDFDSHAGLEPLFDAHTTALTREIEAAGPVRFKTIHAARHGGFDNVNLDLLYGLPGQALASWQASLQRALDLQPDHLSLYALTIEADYVQQMLGGQRSIAEEEVIGQQLELADTMIMGLRLLHEGLAFERFRRRFGTDPRQRYRYELAKLISLGLVELRRDRVTLSRRGYLLGSQVFLHFLPD